MNRARATRAAALLGVVGACALAPRESPALDEFDSDSSLGFLGLELSPIDTVRSRLRVAGYDSVDREHSQVIGHLSFPSLELPRTTGAARHFRSGGLDIGFDVPEGAAITRATDNVLLRAQCPLVESWSAIDAMLDISTAVPCRVVFGDAIDDVARRASQVLARRGRSVAPEEIARDLARIPLDARLSRAMIVAQSALPTGAPWQPPSDVEIEDRAPRRGRHPSVCRQFRSRWRVSSSMRHDLAIVSEHPEWDRGAALSRCWGPHGEWALGVSDRSYVIRDDVLLFRVWARLGFIRPDGRMSSPPDISGSMNEDFGIRAAVDLDGDGTTELILDHRGGLSTGLRIFTVRRQRIEDWNPTPANLRWIADVNGDGRLELLSRYGPPGMNDDFDFDLLDDDSAPSAWFRELWERADGGFSNRTPLAMQYAARQCPAIPQPMITSFDAPRSEVVANVRCARLRGLSPEETVFRFCSAPCRPCVSALGLRRWVVDVARDDVPFVLR